MTSDLRRFSARRATTRPRGCCVTCPPPFHPETDEFFLVLSGSLTIRMDERDVRLEAGDAYVVPRGRFHQPHANGETTLLLFEPSGTVNTGDTPGALTAERRVV